MWQMRTVSDHVTLHSDHRSLYRRDEMKRALIGGGIAGILLLSGLVWSRGQALAPPGPAVEASKEAHTLRTSGSASVRIKPGAARVFFGVQTQAATVKEARTEDR